MLAYNVFRSIQLPAALALLHTWHPCAADLLNERSAVDSLLFPVKLAL